MDYVFDFDGTIAKEGKVSNENLETLKSIKNKILNTSRSYEDLPDEVKKIFNKVICLNGSLFYENGILVHEEKKLTNDEWNKIKSFAIENKYNIGLNSTKQFCNVSNEESKKFMNLKGIPFKENIPDIDDIYFVSLSDPIEVKELPIDIHYSRMSRRFIEISHNNKGNIDYFTNNFIAFGDGENDKPMFLKAKEHKVIGKDIMYSNTWIKEVINE